MKQLTQIQKENVMTSLEGRWELFDAKEMTFETIVINRYGWILSASRIRARKENAPDFAFVPLAGDEAQTEFELAKETDDGKLVRVEILKIADDAIVGIVKEDHRSLFYRRLA